MHTTTAMTNSHYYSFGSLDNRGFSISEIWTIRGSDK